MFSSNEKLFEQKKFTFTSARLKNSCKISSKKFDGANRKEPSIVLGKLPMLIIEFGVKMFRCHHVEKVKGQESRVTSSGSRFV